MMRCTPPDASPFRARPDKHACHPMPLMLVLTHVIRAPLASTLPSPRERKPHASLTCRRCPACPQGTDTTPGEWVPLEASRSRAEDDTPHSKGSPGQSVASVIVAPSQLDCKNNCLFLRHSVTHCNPRQCLGRIPFLSSTPHSYVRNVHVFITAASFDFLLNDL